MGALKPWHIAVVVVVLILLFGAKKLPDMARSMGKSLRIMKAETKNLRESDVEAKAPARHDDEHDDDDARHDHDARRSPKVIEDQPAELLDRHDDVSHTARRSTDGARDQHR